MSGKAFSRRDFAALLAASFLASAAGRAQAQDILVDHFMGKADSDYIRYARSGPYRTNQDPVYTWIGLSESDDKVQVLVTWSRDISNPRLIVFSHGAVTEPHLYRYLYMHWASHGYIVVAPVHDDSVIRRGLSIRQADAHGGAIWDFSGLLHDFELWENRTRACSSVLDEVPVLNRTFGIEINAERPIIIGHSYGAFTAQLLLGATVRTQRGEANYMDPRWAGSILMSPQGAGIMGLHEQSWVSLSRPLLVLTGGMDADASGQDAGRKADIFWRSPPKFKHFGYMANGDFTIYTGQSARPGNYEERLFADLRSVTTAFLKAYAEHDTTAYGHLLDDYFSARTLEFENAATGMVRHSRIYMQSR